MGCCPKFCQKSEVLGTPARFQKHIVHRFFGKYKDFSRKNKVGQMMLVFSFSLSARQIRAAPVSRAAFATASATAGPTRLSNALGMM